MEKPSCEEKPNPKNDNSPTFKITLKADGRVFIDTIAGDFHLEIPREERGDK